MKQASLFDKPEPQPARKPRAVKVEAARPWEAVYKVTIDDGDIEFPAVGISIAMELGRGCAREGRKVEITEVHTGDRWVYDEGFRRVR